MEAKFCPQCGTPRLGNFCGKCGFNFKAHETTSVSSSAHVQETLTEDVNKRTIPTGLVMGDKFEPKSHCDNCGLKLDKKSKCKECGE